MTIRVSGRPRLALAVGWATCMVAIAMTAYDGVMSVIFGPIVAAVCSGCVVGVAWLLGQALLLIPPLRRPWRKGRTFALLIVIACLAVMTLGSSLGLTEVYTDPETGHQFVGLHSAAALTAYVLLLSVIANWPDAETKAALLDDVDFTPPHRTTAWAQIGCSIRDAHMAWSRGRTR